MQKIGRGMMHKNVGDLRQLFGQSLAQRHITKSILEFSAEEGIVDILASRRKFRFADIREVLSERLGYDLAGGIRVRMMRIILDLLAECGFADNDRGTYTWKGIDGSITALTKNSLQQATGIFNGQTGFFDRCIAYAGEFLRGSEHLFRFNEESVPVWEAFLGNAEFELARRLLIKMLISGGSADGDLLDLCPGLGFDILAIQDLMPDTRVTALDFTGVFYRDAGMMVQDPDAVRWTDSSLWKGFGNPLPFDDRSFDLVFFACADPYIPHGAREDVYRDIFRILKKGGSLGILTNSYPDPDRRMVRDPWVRRGNLCHDFAESVCEGWHGFSLPGDSAALFKRIGFDISSVMLNASLWRLERP